MHRTPGKHALTFILISVLIDTIGFGIIIPVLPKLIMELTGKNLSEAALYGGWLLFLYAAIQFFAAPVLGGLSDQFGRRPVLLISLGAFGLDYLIMGLAPVISWLFIGRALAGIFGGTFTIANAYIADISPPEKRAANFGMIGAAWGLGFISGPVLGGLLAGLGPRAPFFAAASVALVNVVYGYFVLPETHALEHRRKFQFSRANPAGALLHMRKYPAVLGMFAAVLLYQLGHDANPAVFTYYAMEKFAWTEREVGIAMGVIGVSIMIVQAGIIRAVIPRIGEKMAVYLGLGLFALGEAGFAASTTAWMVYLCMIPMALGGIGFPAMRSLMSNRLPADEQGALSGAITSVMSLTMIFSPLIMTRLFRVFTSDAAHQGGYYVPGAPYYLGAAMLLTSALVFLAVMRATPPPPKSRLQPAPAEA